MSTEPLLRTEDLGKDYGDGLGLATLDLTVGPGEPTYCAGPASARNSRRRENHATSIEARKPSTTCRTITVMK